MKLQEALTALENKVRSSLNRIIGVQVEFVKIERRGGFFKAVYTVSVPITEPEEEER